MPCRLRDGQLRLPSPLGTLQCTEGRDKQALCSSLAGADRLALSDHRRMENRIEKALLRNMVGRCAGWLLLLIFRRRTCMVDVSSTTPYALQQCAAAVEEGEEPAVALEMLQFYTDAAARTPPNESIATHTGACVAYKVDQSEHQRSLIKRLRLVYHPYSATNHLPVPLNCPLSLSNATRLGIPPLVHFVYSLRKNASFGFMHLIAVLSALVVHRPKTIMFHYSYLPQGFFWDAALKTGHLTLKWIDPRSAQHFGGRCMRHVAHRADVIRLRVLLRYGGDRAVA